MRDDGLIWTPKHLVRSLALQKSAHIGWTCLSTSSSINRCLQNFNVLEGYVWQNSRQLSAPAEQFLCQRDSSAGQYSSNVVIIAFFISWTELTFLLIDRSLFDETFHQAFLNTELFLLLFVSQSFTPTCLYSPHTLIFRNKVMVTTWLFFSEYPRRL